MSFVVFSNREAMTAISRWRKPADDLAQIHRSREAAAEVQ